MEGNVSLPDKIKAMKNKIPRSGVNFSFEKIEKLIQTDENLYRELTELKDKPVSDVISLTDNGEKLQWINFVQQGGGTLGVSLVGYAAALEYLGIRFLRLAGTSAGAINTLFLAAIGEKEDPKTPELFDMVMDNHRFNMRGFVDSRWGIVRKAIYASGRNPHFLKNTLMAYLVLFILVLIPLPAALLIGEESKPVYFYFLGAFLILSSVIAVLLHSFGRFNYGINPGHKFLTFLAEELEKFGVRSQADLDKKARRNFNTLNITESEFRKIQKELKENDKEFRAYVPGRARQRNNTLFLNISTAERGCSGSRGYYR